MIRYTSSLDRLEADDLEGFFEGWPNPPSARTHLELLRNSSEVVLAVDEASGRVVGFANAIADGVLSAYVPLLEVRAAYRGRGIGKQLVRRLLERLDGYYMVDLVCDPELVPFYEGLGLQAGTAMMRRDHAHQDGRPPTSA